MSAGAMAVGHELTREPTVKELELARATELGSRWLDLTAGEIFPATVEYSLGLRVELRKTDRKPRAHRIGIAPASGCTAALDRKAADILTRHHCRAMLRATYVDESGTLVATIGVAVMPTAKDAADTEADFGSIGGTDRYGLLPVRFPNSAAERFDAKQRQVLALSQARTPYVFFRVSGWADGRRTLKEDDRQEDMFEFARQITIEVVDRFMAADDPCRTRRVQC
ncbi:hypothetical protein GCM10009780_19710 [Actinomadura alba]